VALKGKCVGKPGFIEEFEEPLEQKVPDPPVDPGHSTLLYFSLVYASYGNIGLLDRKLEELRRHSEIACAVGVPP